MGVYRDDLSVLLSKSEPALTVKVLLDNLALTTEFESSFVKKWATQVRLHNDFAIMRLTYIVTRDACGNSKNDQSYSKIH